jgi:actin-related protein
MSKNLEQLESIVDGKEVIVIDCGTESIKIGYSGEDQPRIELESKGGTFSIKDETDSIQSKK